MAAPIAGSTAGPAFDDALELLAGTALADPRRRVPYEYAVDASTDPVEPWDPPRVATLPDASGPIVEAARAMRQGHASSSALVERSVTAAISAAHLGGVAELCADPAREQAVALDRELAAGRDRGPLHGIPITVKDVIDVAGCSTRAGSAAYLERPTHDASGVARLRAAGAVVVAKATTHEFALGVTTPQSRNPHDPERIPGGSSGGSAVCVVRGIGLGSLGTDTRASIRVPAALSGAVGLKPTYGRIPTDGVVTLSWTMDHLAPLAASVTDAALLLDALLGNGSRLAWTAPGLPAGLRVGIAASGFAGADPGVTAAVAAALDALVDLGAETIAADTPSDADLALASAVGLVVSRCEAAAAHRSLGLDRARYWQEVAEQLDRGDAIAAVDYLDAQRLRAELRDRLLGAFVAYDVVAMPTTPVVAPPIEDFARYLMVLARNAIPWSLVGFPALSLPVGNSGGLPVGLQLVAAPRREDLLVRVGQSLEARLAGRG